jgi:hypothetical protein
MSVFHHHSLPQAGGTARTTDANAELSRAQRAAQRDQRAVFLATESVVDPRRARALPPPRSSGAAGQQAMRSAAAAYDADDDDAPRSSNLMRLALMRNAEALRAAEDAAWRAPSGGPRFQAIRAPHRPQGPRPHLYGSLHEDPLPLLGPRSAVLQAYMERLRAEEATLGGAALVPAPMAEHIEALVGSARGAPPPVWRAAR